MGDYVEERLKLAPQPFRNALEWNSFLDAAFSSARKSTNEGLEEALPFANLMVCRDCGKTESRACAIPPRPFEKHNFVDIEASTPRTDPSLFRSTFAEKLPKALRFASFDVDRISRPDGIQDDEKWVAWTSCMKNLCNGQETSVFRLTRLQRSLFWSAHYASADGSRLECRISSGTVLWLVFLPASPKSPIKSILERPVARLLVTPSATDTSFNLLEGEWELLLPTFSSISLRVEGSGKRVESWRNRLGLMGGFERELQYEVLEVSVESMSLENPTLKHLVEGSYTLLPDCGGACGSLRKKLRSGDTDSELYFFLDSGRIRSSDLDRYVFSSSCHRTTYGEYREALLELAPTFRPLTSLGDGDDDDDSRCKQSVTAVAHGLWSNEPRLNLQSMDLTFIGKHPSSHSSLKVPIHSGSWSVCPLVTSCHFPVGEKNDVFRLCSRSSELNLQK
jgi:hypothetical protein